MRLASLIGGKSLFLFNILGVTMYWLNEPPSQWNKNIDYLETTKFVRQVKVVNDLAEKAVKLTRLH